MSDCLDAVDLPNEILLEIFEIGCYNEYIQQRDLWRPRPSKSRFRRPKGFVIPLTRVCSKWRRLVQEYDGLWITSIKVNYEVLNTLQDNEMQMLQSSGNSDIDVSIQIPRPESATSKAMKFLINNIIPLSNQWRSFRASAFAQETVDIVWQELNKFHSLPRLLYIDIHSSMASSLPPLLPSLPRLCKLSTTSFSWDHDRFSFSSLEDLEILQGKSQPFTFKSLQTALFSSSQTIRCLSLQVNLEEHTPNLQMTFPSVTLFRLAQDYLLDAMLTLANFHLPALKELQVAVTSDSDLSRLTTVHDHILLAKCQQLILSMPVLCIAKFCSKLLLPMLSELLVGPTAFDATEVIREVSSPTIAFPALQNMTCSWSQFRGCRDTLTHFLLQFDLSRITVLRLRSTASPLTRTFLFPNLETLKVDSIEILEFIHAPCLNILHIREEEHNPFPEDWIAILQKSPIDMSRIKEMSLYIERPSRRLPDRMSSLFMKLEKFTLQIPGEVKLPMDLSNGYGFPLLKDCQLRFPIEMKSLSPERVSEMKSMVDERIAAGLPLQLLRLSALPSSEDDIKWFKEKVPDFGPYVPVSEIRR